jgi:hypothetical protein
MILSSSVSELRERIYSARGLSRLLFFGALRLRGYLLVNADMPDYARLGQARAKSAARALNGAPYRRADRDRR